jgi:hypothetical protein
MRTRVDYRNDYLGIGFFEALVISKSEKNTKQPQLEKNCGHETNNHFRYHDDHGGESMALVALQRKSRENYAQYPENERSDEQGDCPECKRNDGVVVVWVDRLFARSRCARHWE